MNKFNLSKGLLDTVSGIVKTSKQEHVEQNNQFNAAMREKVKVDAVKPLTAEQLSSIPKREPKDLALHNVIRGIATQSAEAAAAEQQTAEGRINSMYRSSGGRGRGLSEAKTAVKLDPVGQEDSDVNNDGKVNKSDSYLKNRRKAVGAAIKNEEVEVEEGVMDTVKKVAQTARIAAKKTLRKVGGGTDAQQLQRLRDSMKEDVEQVDELSRKTLTNYINKVAGQKGAQAGSHDAGLAAAAKKIAMKKKLGEDVEQVDELSRMTLTNYINKVAKKKGAQAGEHDSGLKAASKKIAMKKKMGEEVERIEEGSMNNMTLGQLKKKHEHHYTSNNQNYPGAENDVDDDPDRMEKHAKASKAIEDHVANAYGSGARRTMVADSRRKVKEIHKSMYNEDVEQVEEADRSAGTVFDKDVAKSFTKKKPGELTGHESKKTSTGTEYTKKAKKEDEDVKEEIEQVDELNSKTLRSYVDKAVDRVSDTQFRAGKHWEKGNKKSADYESRETLKRMRGIHKATGRMTKEEVELTAEEADRIAAIAAKMDGAQ